MELNIETGAVSSGYNDVRIPGDGGTLFSLSEELEVVYNFALINYASFGAVIHF